MSANVQKLVIRPAEANDIEVAVPLIYSAGMEAWDLLFGSGAPDSSLPYLRRAWVAGKGVAGYRAHWVAEIDGEVVAAASVYSRAEHASLANETVLHAIRYFGWRVSPRLLRMLNFGKKLAPAPGEDVDYLANFGVASQARGRGVGTSVLSYFLARAAGRGKRQFELDVAISNPRGQQLYERFGMSVLKERHYLPFERRGLSGIRRMGMPVKQ